MPKFLTSWNQLVGDRALSLIKRLRGKLLSPIYRKLSKAAKRLRGKLLSPISRKLSRIAKRFQVKFLSYSYRKWIIQKAHTSNDLSRLANENIQFSVLLPIEKLSAGERWKLRQSIRSVLAQRYSHWQLCIASHTSAASRVQSVLKSLDCLADSRIVVTTSEQKSGAIVANAALSSATGEFVTLLAGGDEIAPSALYEVAWHLQRSPQTDLIYTDEDCITYWGQRKRPFFKPDWSPDYFHAYPNACRSSWYRTDLLRRLNGFRDRYNSAHSWDLSLRAAEQANSIHHLAKVLYHRRISVSGRRNGLNAQSAQVAQQVLQSALDRSDYPGSVELISKRPVLFRVRRQILNEPLISILIPSAGVYAEVKGDRTCLLVQCIRSIRQRSTYQNIEIIVVDGQDISAETLAAIQADDLKVVHDDQPFNFSTRMNLAAQHAKGDFLLMLNDDIEVITPDWIESLLEFAQQTDIGMVGAKLLYPDRRLQHAGVVVLSGIPTHAFHKGRSSQKGYHYSNIITRNYIGVTGACLMMRRSLFEELNGFDENFPSNFNDVDLCLRAYQAGYRSVFTPHAVLIHYESISRGKSSNPSDLARLRQKFSGASFMERDPYYNPNLSYLRPFFQLAWPEENQQRHV